MLIWSQLNLDEERRSVVIESRTLLIADPRFLITGSLRPTKLVLLRKSGIQINHSILSNNLSDSRITCSFQMVTR